MLIKTMVLVQSTNESEILSKINEGVSNKTQTISTSNSFWDLLGLVLLLIFILVATYFTTKFIGKYKSGQMASSNFEVIDTYRISQSKFLQIIKVSNKYILIAVCKDQISYITELEEAQVLTRDDKSSSRQSFAQVMDYFRNKK